MTETNQYIAINRTSWNDRVDVHMQSAFYRMDVFRQGATSLNAIELALLGDVRGKRILHLQCHFGQDSLSLARLGAKVTGMDLSDKAIDAARQLATELELDATFVCCNLYDLPKHLEGSFDVVFTSYGVIGWLPDLDGWASVIDHFLAPGGRFILVEFHPVVWMFSNDFSEVAYSYFNREAIVEELEGTYADRDAQKQFSSISWNHGLGEVLSPLLKRGLQLRSLEEFDYSPYDCFDQVVEIAPGKYQIAPLHGKIPLVYALEATKP